MNDMNSSKRLLTCNELEQIAIDLEKNIPTTNIDFSDVPNSLKPLIPYVEIWGVVDDFEREEIIDRTSPVIKDNLKWVIGNFDNELDEWLAGPEAESSNPSDAYVSFSAFRMAVDSI